MRRVGHQLTFVLTVLVAAGLSAEVIARFDDWVRYGTPLGVRPDPERDLRVTDSLGVHGRPHGRYQQFRLNNFGFRSERDNSPSPIAGCTRIITVGASETLGMYERPGQEYPAQLQKELDRVGGCYEVLNAGIAGMSLPGISATWSRFWRKLRPDFVVVYPAPAFYLGITPPSPPNDDRAADAEERWPYISLYPRVLHRAREAIEVPMVVQRQRVRRRIASDVARIRADSLWQRLPEDRLKRFHQDLRALSLTISASGATPVLLTHASRFRGPVSAADRDLLESWRSYTPRATESVLVSFDSAAAEVTRVLARDLGVVLVDVDRCLSGRAPYFGDFVHFTELGASKVATMVASALTGTDWRSVSRCSAP